MLVALAAAATSFGSIPGVQAAEPSVPEWTPGVGSGILSAGRFGWRKGDGLLDFTYNKFGVMERPVFSGHPLNRTGNPWQIDIRPPFAHNDKEIDPSEWPEIIKDECSANWISVQWKSEFVSTGDWKGRQKGDQFSFTVSYSIVSPGLVVETDDKAFRIALASTPGYETVELPLGAEPSARPIAPDKPVIYDAKTDGKLAENWVLLRGGPYPDVPLLLVFARNPVAIEQERKDGRLDALCVTFEPSVERVILCAPFGVKAFEADESAKPETRAEIVKAARFWSKALLAYIVDCKERFNLDEPAGKVVIRQEFVHRIFQDEWKTTPIKTAPFPPLLSIAGGVCDSIRTVTPVDPETPVFPARYGLMRIPAGSDVSVYELPIPPMSAKIPIPPVGSPVKVKAESSCMIDMIDPGAPLPPSCFPGLWSRVDRSSVDVSSLYAFWYWLWPYLSERSQANLRVLARSLLLDLLDDQAAFEETPLFASIQQTPDDADKLTRPIWFSRKEPFTGKEYVLSYTVPNVRREGKDVSNPAYCFTDTEWGNGLALQGIEQGARLSGDWESVRRNWAMVRKIEGLFELLQDWAYLSVSGTEAGSRWTDPSSYYGYIAYRKLADEVGSAEERRQAVYLHAKHAASRLAMAFAGEYLAGVYQCKPWKINHAFVEMDSGYKVPEPQRDGRSVYPAGWLRGDASITQRNSFYSLVAEGVNYETADLFYSLAPKATHEFLVDYLRLFPEWITDDAWSAEMNKRHANSGGISICELLLFKIRDPATRSEDLATQMKRVTDTDLVRNRLSGFYDRYKGGQEYVEAMAETRDDPAWIESWRGITIGAAAFDRDFQTVAIGVSPLESAGVLTLGGARPKRVRLGDADLPEANSAAGDGWAHAAGYLRIPVHAAGTLAIQY
jgi:hypothetical protein